MNDMKNEKMPLTEAFLQQYTLAVQVERSNSVNGGAPVVTGYIVDRTLDDPKAMIASRRPIVAIAYQGEGEANAAPITFYGPNGYVARTMTEEEMSNISDSEINPQLNVLWGLEADSPFMRKVGEAVVMTCTMLTAAAMIASATGAKAMDVFTDLQRQSMDRESAAVLRMGDDGNLRDAGSGEQVDSLASYRAAAKATEGATNEG